MLKIVLFQPEIAENVGSIIRNCACFNAQLHIIEPCGFPFDINRIKRSAMDYINYIEIYRHASFEIFYQQQILNTQNRLILSTTKAKDNIFDFKFLENDYIIFGKESAGAPDFIHNQVDYKIQIKMHNNQRSLNLAISCGIILAKANNDIY
jgi:tRNA (cytidine/uridine-2'-O-)-methyltransferase